MPLTAQFKCSRLLATELSRLSCNSALACALLGTNGSASGSASRAGLAARPHRGALVVAAAGPKKPAAKPASGKKSELTYGADW